MICLCFLFSWRVLNIFLLWICGWFPWWGSFVDFHATHTKMSHTPRCFIQLVCSSSMFQFHFFLCMWLHLACFSTESAASVKLERLKFKQKGVCWTEVSGKSGGRGEVWELWWEGRRSLPPQERKAERPESWAEKVTSSESTSCK